MHAWAVSLSLFSRRWADNQGGNTVELLYKDTRPESDQDTILLYSPSYIYNEQNYPYNEDTLIFSITILEAEVQNRRVPLLNQYY